MIQAKLGIDSSKLDEEEFIKKSTQAIWIVNYEKEMFLNGIEMTIRKLFNH